MPAARTMCCPRAAARAPGAGFRPGTSCAARACRQLSQHGIAPAGPGGRRAGRRRRLGGAPARCRGAQVKQAIVARRDAAPDRNRGGACTWLFRCAPRRASCALCRAGRGTRRQIASRFQRKHGGLFAGGVARPSPDYGGATRDVSRNTKRLAAPRAALWRAAGGDAVDQWRGRRAAPVGGHIRRAGQHGADSRADIFDVSFLFRGRRSAR